MKGPILYVRLETKPNITIQVKDIIFKYNQYTHNSVLKLYSGELNKMYIYYTFNNEIVCAIRLKKNKKYTSLKFKNDSMLVHKRIKNEILERLINEYENIKTSNSQIHITITSENLYVAYKK